MADNQTSVVYKAIADFTALSRATKKAKRDLADLRREEERLNSQSVAGSAAATVATGKHAKSREVLTTAIDGEAGSIRSSTTNFLENSKAVKDNSEGVKNLGSEISETSKVSEALSETIRKSAQQHREHKKSSDALGQSMRRESNESRSLGRAFRDTLQNASKLDEGLTKLGNWHPRLIPPFIALVPVIAGLLALLNPLVAGLGAVGGAAIGLASSLGRVAAGAIGAIPALATIVSLVAAMKVAFGGIGGAFKAFSSMQKATGGGGGTAAKAELTQTEELARAQEEYARSIQDVSWAQEDLDSARKDYIKRLYELQKAVDRASAAEARAAANSQLARENYANVLADPGSTKGQKMDAKVGVDEAQAAYQDVVDQNIQNQKDLLVMQQKGIEGDKAVIQATRALADAINKQRDAELNLINTQNGANKAAGGGASAAQLYEQALAKLSPSARRFVEILVGMNDAWTALRKNVQEAFFSKFVNDMGLLNNLLPSVQSLLSDTAGAVGLVVSRLLKLLTSPDWQRDLILIGKQNVPIIENIGTALLALLNVFRDLAIVAGPFLTTLTEGLARGAENFQAIVAAARADGSLASYLERVNVAMSQWWRIVQNVGKTLFNFSAAAGSFGEWLTNGLEAMTQAWLKSSEAARQKGSPFQIYLENIKPLLSEVKGLFGDFFQWFARTSSDPDNIRQFTDIVKMLRDDLGPALSRILDILSKSGVGESFVKAIVSIVEAIATLLENGGIEGIQAFYTAVSTLFDALDGFLSTIPKPLLTLLVESFGTLAALRFFNLTKVLGLLIQLAKSGRILSILDKLPFIGAGGSAGRHAATGALGGVAGRVGTAATGVAVAAKGGLQKAMTFLTGLGGKVTAQAGPKAAQGFNLLGSIGKGAGRGAGIGAVASILGTVGGDLISSSAPKGSAGSGQRVGGNALAGAASGAGIGALVGSIIPGLGTAVGAAVGGVIGGGVGLATSDPKDIQKMLADWGNFFTDVGKWLATVWTGFMNWLTVDLPGWLGSIADGFMNWLTVDLPGWLGSIADGFMNWLTVDLPYDLGYVAGLFWNWLTVDMPAWLATVWTGFMNWLTVDLPGWLASAASAFWKWLTVDLPAWIGQTAAFFWKWLTVDLPAWIGQAANTFWNWLTVGIPNGIGQAANAFWKFLTQDIPGWIGQAASSFWKWLTVDIPNGLARMWNDFLGSFGLGFAAGAKKKNKGGVISRAGGGGVPGSGSTDTVPAMLTPGEFVLRKAVVSDAGIGNLTKFNAGVMSYASLLQEAMANQSGNSKSDKKGNQDQGLSFFDGGGLVPSLNFGSGAAGGQPPGPNFGNLGGPGVGGGFTVENLTVINPAPEPASDSLPRSIRKVAYLGSKR